MPYGHFEISKMKIEPIVVKKVKSILMFFTEIYCFLVILLHLLLYMQEDALFVMAFTGSLITLVLIIETTLSHSVKVKF